MRVAALPALFGLEPLFVEPKDPPFIGQIFQIEFTPKFTPEIVEQIIKRHIVTGREISSNILDKFDLVAGPKKLDIAYCRFNIPGSIWEFIQGPISRIFDLTIRVNEEFEAYFSPLAISVLSFEASRR